MMLEDDIRIPRGRNLGRNRGRNRGRDFRGEIARLRREVKEIKLTPRSRVEKELRRSFRKEGLPENRAKLLSGRSAKRRTASSGVAAAKLSGKGTAGSASSRTKSSPGRRQRYWKKPARPAAIKDIPVFFDEAVKNEKRGLRKPGYGGNWHQQAESSYEPSWHVICGVSFNGQG